MSNLETLINNISNDDLQNGGSALQISLQRRQQFLNQANTALKTEIDDVQPLNDIYDKGKTIRQDSKLTEDIAKQLKNSATNDNCDESGEFTPLPSPAITTINGEATLENSAPIVDEEQIANKCAELNLKVALKANSCQRSNFSAQLEKIPENLRYLAIPEDPSDLAVFAQTGEKAIEAAKISLKNKKNITAQEYHKHHEQAREFGFIALDAALKLSIALNAVKGCRGGRSDLHPEKYVGENRFQGQIYLEDFGLSPKVASRFKKLTAFAVEQEKKFANDNDEIPTITHALGFAKSTQTKKPKVKDISSCDNTVDEILKQNSKKYDIIYADFGKFSSGIDLSAIANSDCLLYLWVSNGQVANAIDFVRQNGFEFVGNYVFVRSKSRPGGKYMTDCHSHVVICTKGKFPKSKFRTERSVAYENEIGENLGYDYYKSVIEENYPDKTLLDLVTQQSIETTENNSAICNTSVSQEVCND